MIIGRWFHLQATPKQTEFQRDDDVQSELSPATTATQDASEISMLVSDDKPVTVPLQLPDHSSYTTHRAVSPVLPSYEKPSGLPQEFSEWESSPKEARSSELFSPMSDQFLLPPDYEAIFSGHQTLRASECSQASLNDLSPVSPVFSDSSSAQVVTREARQRRSETAEDYEFSPEFKRVLSEFERTVSEFESEEPNVPLKEPRKSPESPLHSDSDLEFFDCRQDFSEPDDGKAEQEVVYHIYEPPSPVPRRTSDVGFLKGSSQHVARPFLQVEDHKRFSSGSESLCEFAYDSEASREGPTEGGLPMCEELPSRDQAGFYDGDDFLGRVSG